MFTRLLVVALSLILLTTACVHRQALTLATYNIRNGKGMDNKTDLSRTAEVLKSFKADVIAVQEADSATVRSGGRFVLGDLAEKGSWRYLFAPAIAYNGGTYGVGILSKKGALRHYAVPLPGREEERVLLVAEFKRHVVFCTHLSLNAADRAASLAIINGQAALFTKPVYLMGDLNAEPGSDLLNAVTGDSCTFTV
jgi:endonuclease/exonuclease/phosphatase family metal-dependent hydrolase